MPEHPEVEHWIRSLGLQPHPEGGFYRETYRASLDVPLPGRGPRSSSTAIYFLLTAETFSALHRIHSDELWFFHAGDPLQIEVLNPDGLHESLRVGPTAHQAVVRAGCWFGARVARGGAYSLVSCVVAPGFDFRDFEMARACDLIAQFPLHESWIRTLTRN